jgi:hypothetical protein
LCAFKPNTLSITVGDTGHRIIYPYVCEDPGLCDEAARLGLWLMSKSIKRYALQDMRLLDIIRGRSFSTLDTPLAGNDEKLFAEKYKALVSEWNALRAEYS